jgi:small subunit ribosomal protein S18
MASEAGNRAYHTTRRFPDRGGPEWVGPIVDYKEIELLRKFLTSSSKVMSRKRAGTNAQEQKALKLAIKRARFLALVPYSGT